MILALGVSQFRHFGIGFDEPGMRAHGIAESKYLLQTLNPELYGELSEGETFRNAPDLTSEDPINRSYGAVFEVALIGIEYLLNLTEDKRKLWEYRHLANYLFCGFGLIVFVLFIYIRFKSRVLAILSALLMVCSPRVFADFYYNNKDSVFLTFYLLASISAILFVTRRRKLYFLVSAVLIGIATSMRAPGILIEVVLISTLVLHRGYKECPKIKLASISISHILLVFASLILFQPYFWSNPVSKIVSYFLSSKNFSYPGCTLTAGNCFANDSLPFYYIPLWIVATTPIFISLLILYGIFKSSHANSLVVRKSIGGVSTHSVVDSMMMAFFLVPLALAIASKSTLYDGWRHFYFIYPMLMYFAIYACHQIELSRSALVRNSARILIISNVVMTLSWMNLNKPLYNLYFTQFAGQNIESRWETDYWNLSGRDALTWIVANDQKEVIKIQTSDNSPLYDSSVFLSEHDKNRVDFLWFSEGLEEADYMVVRPNPSQPGSTTALLRPDESFEMVRNRIVGSALIYEIYKRKTPKPFS
jgi:hypothetical protein